MGFEIGLLRRRRSDRGVRSGSTSPEDAFVEVSYEGEWLWIANDDWKSKRSFTSILFPFTLADAGDDAEKPVLTIPTQ
jgi:hypothetical protein